VFLALHTSTVLSHLPTFWCYLHSNVCGHVGSCLWTNPTKRIIFRRTIRAYLFVLYHFLLSFCHSFFNVLFLPSILPFPSISDPLFSFFSHFFLFFVFLPLTRCVRWWVATPEQDICWLCNISSWYRKRPHVACGSLTHWRPFWIRNQVRSLVCLHCVAGVGMPKLPASFSPSQSLVIESWWYNNFHVMHIHRKCYREVVSTSNTYYCFKCVYKTTALDQRL